MLLVALGMTFSPKYLLIFNQNNFNCGILSRSDIVGICPVGFCLDTELDTVRKLDVVTACSFPGNHAHKIV